MTLIPLTAAQVLERIDPEAIARDALAFVEVASETGREGPGSLFLAELLKREGFQPELDEVAPERPNVYARIAGSGGGPALVFNGHTDTIPIGNSAPPVRDGDWISGRGAEDMKGGLVAMVHAASALQRAGVKLSGDLWLTGVVGHEAPEGKKEGPIRLIQHLRSGRIPAGAIVIVEGPCAIWAASLGSAVFTIEVKDDRGPIHTIKVPYETNPAYWVGKLLTELQEREEQFKTQPAHPLCGRQLYNVGMVHGGDYMNRLPARFRITGTRRWTPGIALPDIHAEFEEICRRYAAGSGMHWSYFLDGEREPFETPSGHAIVRALSESAREVSGAAPEIVGMGLVGDANLYSNEAGVAAVYYGPAHQTAHSDDERVSISRLAHCASVYALAAALYCQASS
ncbi:MAG: M20/M25/M40 family metallo-hydrolase [Bryobacteraceae bacterium]|nr:M20/M25/M40 family metallo-hydrolase [Bryobacteraceae bacterium]